MLTTETLVAEIPEEKKAPTGGGHGGGMEGMYLNGPSRQTRLRRKSQAPLFGWAFSCVQQLETRPVFARCPIVDEQVRFRTSTGGCFLRSALQIE
jgi:hypothetical protein